MSWTESDLNEVERAIVKVATLGQEVQYKDRRYRMANIDELYRLRDHMRREMGKVKRKRRQGVLYK